ncbi:hypothetical protein RPX00_09520 [Amycolatopsis sp. WGS_07]
MIDTKDTATPLPAPPPDAEPRVERPPLSGHRLVAAALLGLGVLGTVFTVMWLWINTTPAMGEQKTIAHLEVFKTTASVAVMLGGLGVLYLAARRQRTQEAEHHHAVRTAEINRKHAERVAAAAEDDAARRRVTDLYAKAADQLGSDKAPVRLAGLYALERVGQDNPDQRQTIIKVLCAYLRMPYEQPLPVTRPRQDPHNDLIRQQVGEQRPQWEEREVRLTAQRIVTDHLELVAPDEDDSNSWGPPLSISAVRCSSTWTCAGAGSVPLCSAAHASSDPRFSPMRASQKWPGSWMRSFTGSLGSRTPGSSATRCFIRRSSLRRVRSPAPGSRA